MEADGKPTREITFYAGPADVQVMSLSFSSNGRLLAVGSTPGNVDIWDVEKCAKLHSFRAGTPLALSPDGRLLATNGEDIQIRDATSGKLLQSIIDPALKECYAAA
jgi:WD40 repeat protein